MHLLASTRLLTGLSSYHWRWKMDRFRVSRISLIEKCGKPVNTELTGRMILRLFHGLSSCLPQLMFLKAASLSSPNCAISGPGRCGEVRLCLTTGEKRHVRHRSCDRDSRNPRKDYGWTSSANRSHEPGRSKTESSYRWDFGVSHIRVWLRTETSRAILEKADGACTRFDGLKLGDRERKEIIKSSCTLCRQWVLAEISFWLFMASIWKTLSNRHFNLI